jgi:putative hemolysin
MNTVALELALIVLCLTFLFLLSLVESAIARSSKLTLMTMLESAKRVQTPLMATVVEDQMQLIVPLHFGTQCSLITIAILTTHLSLREWSGWGVVYSFLIILMISVSCRQLGPHLLTQHEPERKLIRLLNVFGPILTMLRSLTLPLSGVMAMFKRLNEKNMDRQQKEGNGNSAEKEIQAYLEIGEDEGIIQQEDSKLIQSVVEFGDTLVGEVMTPRTKVIGCNEKATIGELREIMVQNKHSRIPVFWEDIDHIIGIAYMRQLMAEYWREHDSDSIAGLIHPALFVPETRPVSSLLRELQARGDHAAIVIDEFGGVAGLVTIEDIVEEIVGEIRDEDQAKVSEIHEDGPGSYILGGGTELSRLEELLGIKAEGKDCSTIAGLILAYLGRVPAPGEEFNLKGMRVRILDADRRRVHRLRIRLPQ